MALGPGDTSTAVLRTLPTVTYDTTAGRVRLAWPATTDAAAGSATVDWLVSVRVSSVAPLDDVRAVTVAEARTALETHQAQALATVAAPNLVLRFAVLALESNAVLVPPLGQIATLTLSNTSSVYTMTPPNSAGPRLGALGLGEVLALPSSRADNLDAGDRVSFVVALANRGRAPAFNVSMECTWPFLGFSGDQRLDVLEGSPVLMDESWCGAYSNGSWRLHVGPRSVSFEEQPTQLTSWDVTRVLQVPGGVCLTVSRVASDERASFSLFGTSSIDYTGYEAVDCAGSPSTQI